MTLLDVPRADARTRHYSRFYGPVDDQTPVLLVHGNCQAESLRIALSGDDVDAVRIPPVHELSAEDLPHLDRWLARADLLVSQPIRDGFRGLPVGTRQVVARRGRSARAAVVPVVRFAGLYPTHAIVRPPSDTSLAPPVVAYHDLRTLAEAAARRHGRRVREARLTPQAVAGIARDSVHELVRRERAHGTVQVSDLFAQPDFSQMRTLNHPGNPVWEALADRVRSALALAPRTRSVPRPLLDAIHAPRHPAVIEAFGLGDRPEAAWVADGVRIGEGEVHEAHLRFYEEHPDAVDAGLRRHAGALRCLGLL